MRGSLLVLGASIVGCTSTTPSVGTPIVNPDAAVSLGTCGDDGRDLSGVSWSIPKSQFAFGGTPTTEPENGNTRVTGPEGAGIAYANGGAMMIPNATNPGAARPDFGSDSNALTTHVRAYLQSFGIPDCQIGKVNQNATVGMGGPVGGPTTTTSAHLTIVLSRAVDGVSIVESLAYAAMNDQDESTEESLWWPPLPSSVVAQAKQMRTDLGDAAKRAAFEAKLATVGTNGRVAIHHSIFAALPGHPFVARATWDVDNGNATISYDENGARVDPSTYQ